MSDKTKTIPAGKMFFKMGEISELTGIESHVLRSWEGEFPMLKPKKNRSGHRTFSREDIELVLRIKRLIHEEGYTVAGAKKKLEEGEQVVEVRPELALNKQKLVEDVREVKLLLENVLNILDRP